MKYIAKFINYYTKHFSVEYLVEIVALLEPSRVSILFVSNSTTTTPTAMPIYTEKGDRYVNPRSKPKIKFSSQQGRQKELNEYLKQMRNSDTPQIIIGDFNFCYLAKTSSSTKSFLEKESYHQLIMKPTHIEGHVLDQAYLRDTKNMLDITVESQSKYYSDHKGIAIIAAKKKGKT